MRLLAASLIALSVGACAYLDPHGPASLCSSDDPGLANAVDGAVAYWVEAGLVGLRACAAGSVEVHVQQGLAAGGYEGLESETASGPAIRVDPGVLADATSDDARSQSLATMTLAHELGHALGLGHATDRTSIMFPQLRPMTPVSPFDENLAAGLLR